MEQRHTLHIIGSSSTSRAAFARLGYDLGAHCEIYAGVDELLQRPPGEGVVLAVGETGAGSGIALAERTVAALARAGCWLPVVALDPEPATARVVAAARAGVLDVLALPASAEMLTASLGRIAAEVAAHGEAQRRAVAAFRQMAHLSPREREVLDWLTRGCSNKAIARHLTISPRTVEIHRANMMTKLGARHAAEAIRLRLEAEPAARTCSAA